MTKKTKKQRVLVVHTHEKGEGSAIVAVFPDTVRGRRAAKEKQITCSSDNGVDVASLDELIMEEP